MIRPASLCPTLHNKSNNGFWQVFGIILSLGRSKSLRKSAIIFLFGKSAEFNYYSYIDKHDLYLYSNVAALQC